MWKVKKSWETEYKGNIIKVVNSYFNEKLFVNGVLQDETMNAATARLLGEIKEGEGKGERIKVTIGGFLSIECKIFIDDKLVFDSKNR